MGRVNFPLINIRKDAGSTWRMHHYSGASKEKIQIPTEADQFGFYSVFLTEVPDSGTIGGVTTPPIIDGYKEYRGAVYNHESNKLNFGIGQFAVNYSTGELVFPPDSAGETRYVDYWGRGSVIEAEDVNFIHNRVSVLESFHSEPKFLNFEITNQPKILELGSLFPNSGTSVIFKWSTSFPESVKHESIMIRDITNNVVIGQNLSNTGEYTFNYNSKLQFDESKEVIFEIKLTSLSGIGDKITCSIDWVNTIYFGNSDSNHVNPSQIVLMDKLISDNLNNVFIYSTSGYKVFAIPKKLKKPSYAIDEMTRLPILFSQPEEMVLINNQNLKINYDVYVSKYKINTPLNMEVK